MKNRISLLTKIVAVILLGSVSLWTFFLINNNNDDESVTMESFENIKSDTSDKTEILIASQEVDVKEEIDAKEEIDEIDEKEIDEEEMEIDEQKYEPEQETSVVERETSNETKEQTAKKKIVKKQAPPTEVEQVAPEEQSKEETVNEENADKPFTKVEVDQQLNTYVLREIEKYNGSYPYLLNEDYDNYNGVTETIYFNNQKLLRAHPSGNRASHCSGITFEVFFNAMQARNKALGIPIEDFNGMNRDQLFDFILHWYAAQGPKSQSNIVVAVEKYGVGLGVNRLEDARTGDFIDFSRENNTGHTAVFMDWVREGNKIVGFRYWSSQGTTNGISYNTEYFNVTRANGRRGIVIKDQLYIARIHPVSKYRPFN
ncbi:hypothetical protein RH915_04735 [Serpentinicella sp. ANB-PHB4]|uniref:hypothetical protein n=1 Tax=Serpentinicella sp. ANB-PHB4 TaxID=3074076 RepID=UPI0028669B92|nr:hypothetical protein [Serpentinicella sp. ANB-PHB4]MDR5658790.1 hypothetical protein [Serpentinicella sp. ANB-PHB4]